MADAAITLQASNLFDLAPEFKTLSSSTSDPLTNAMVQDSLGNVSCQRNITDITNYTQSVQYCGTDFVVDAADPLYSQWLIGFGLGWDGKVITGITINMSAGEYCTVDLEGHNHANNTHADYPDLSLGYFDVSRALPHALTESFYQWDGFGIPDFGITVGADASPLSATVTCSINHIDQINEEGLHLTGTNRTGRVELTMEFSGIPTSATISAIQTDLRTNTGLWENAFVDTLDLNDSNSDFDSLSFTAHANVDRLIA